LAPVVAVAAVAEEVLVEAVVAVVAEAVVAVVAVAVAVVAVAVAAADSKQLPIKRMMPTAGGGKGTSFMNITL
jgi:hypothetical protein